MTTPARRPGCVPVALAGICAALNVWSFAQADWNGVWGAWLALFLTEELWATWARTGGTLSTRLWVWLGIRPRRAWRQVRIGAAGVFCVEFGAHVVTGGAFWWSGGAAIIWTAVPVAVVVGYALLRERREASVGDQDLGDALGAPWYVRLGLKLGRGGIVGWIGKLFSGRPGVLRTVLALFVLLTVTLPLLGRPEAAQMVKGIGEYIGLTAQAAGVPVDPVALGDALKNFLLALVALVALLRPVVRWVIAGWVSKDLGAVAKTNPSLKG